MARLPLIQLPLTWLLLASTARAADTHFRLWFPQYGPTFEGYMKGCAATYQAYLDNTPCVPNYGGCQSGRMVHCLLSQATESLKANMASAGVVLGLLPTTLCLIGLSTVETGLLAYRRPLLALLLVCGAPAISPVQTFEYRSSLGPFRKSSSSLTMPGPGLAPAPAALAVALQYLVACLAIANLAHVGWELCVKTVCSFSSDTAFQPALWAVVAVPIHVAGRLAVALRFRYAPAPAQPGARSWPQRLHEEFRLAARQPPATIRYRPEAYAHVLCAWCASTGAVLHVMYGTLVFSSLLFISAQDALLVAARYLVSTLMCRMILRIEIRGMAGAVEIGDEGKAEADVEGVLCR